MHQSLDVLMSREVGHFSVQLCVMMISFAVVLALRGVHFFPLPLAICRK